MPAPALSPGPLRSPTPPGLASRPGTRAWWTDALVGSSWIGRRCRGQGLITPTELYHTGTSITRFGRRSQNPAQAPWDLFRFGDTSRRYRNRSVAPQSTLARSLGRKRQAGACTIDSSALSLLPSPQSPLPLHRLEVILKREGEACQLRPRNSARGPQNRLTRLPVSEMATRLLYLNCAQTLPASRYCLMKSIFPSGLI